MSTQPGRQSRSKGWFTFAAVMFLIAAIAHILWGAGAVSGKPYLDENRLLTGSLAFWGWASIAWGGLCGLIAILLAARNGVGLGLALFVLVASTGFWLLTLPLQPTWSLLVIAINVALIYGLASHEDTTF